MNDRCIPDPDERFARHEAWWARERTDGPLLWVAAPRDMPAEDIAEPPTPPLPGKYLDADYIVRHRRWALANTFYGGDAFPVADANLGPGSLALYLGSEPGFSEETVWFKPSVDDLETAPLPEFNPDNEWFQTHLGLVGRLRDELGEDCCVAIPDIVESLDILAAMRDPTALLFDLKDRPGECHRWLGRINALYHPHYDAFHEICRDGQGRSAFTAFCLWGRGRVCKVQCDFAAMISPEAFGEFYVPYVKEQMERLDRVVYHLDGPDCIRHLDQLLGLEKLNAINWVAGAGAPPTGDERWFPMYRKILEAGKGLHMRVQPERLEAVLKAIGTQGVYLLTTAKTEQEAKEMVALARR